MGILVQYVHVTKSRNRGFYAAERKESVFTPTPATYDRPIGPRNAPPSRPWEQRVAFRLVKTFGGREEEFLYKYYHLIHFMDKKINKARAVEQPWTRGMAFTHAVIAAWRELQPAYLRLLKRRERKVRDKPSVPRFSFVRMCEVFACPDEPDVPSCVEDDSTPYVAPPPRRIRDVPLPEWDTTHPLFSPPPVPRERNSALLAVLRAIIWYRRCKRTNVHTPMHDKRRIIKRRSPCMFRNGTPYAWPEGNEAVEDVDQSLTPTVHESNRVCIVETHDCSEVVIPGMNIPASLGAGDIPRSFATMSDDEILFDNFDWTDSATGTVLKQYTLPGHIFNLVGHNPILVPFTIHAFWRGDIQIRAVINANKFQCGQLQLSWWYDANSDGKFNLRNDVYSSSQTPHALANAGTSNECCLKIGYRSPFTTLPTRGTSKDSECLNMGKLIVRVLSPLKSSDSVAKTCSVSLFIKFTNCEFFGSLSTDVGKFVDPEMMEGAVALAGMSLAERALNQILPDNNRDNPPITGPASHMVPHAMQSLCAGTGVAEPINHLRLDARGQVPHLENANTLSTWSDIAKVYGLYHIVKWTKDHMYGKELYSMHAAPIQPLATYNVQTIESDKCYNLPPIAVASSMFSYWRGSLKVRLDVVATGMHTGKLAVVYIPRVLDKVTWSQARGSPHVVIDLKDGVQSYTINIPFITNRYAWPRRINTSGATTVVDPPGKVYIFVINKLIPMEAVSNEVNINIYYAGGDDFELLVPCQPAFGTSFFTTSDKPDTEIKAYGGYWPFYWGYYGDFFGGVKAIARYGKGWQHVAQFQNLKPNCYYRVDAKTATAMPPYMLKNDGTRFTPQFFGPVKLDDGLGWRYLGVFETEEKAKKYAAQPPAKKDYSLFMDVQNNDSGPWSDSAINPVFDEVAVPSCEYIRRVTYAKPENDPNTSEATNDAPVVLECVPPPSTNIAPVTFGEDFNNIKTLMRRYQPYCVLDGVTSSEVGSASVALPLVPQGLDLDIDTFEKQGKFYNKYVRDGTIPIVASAFRYMRGSMRLRIVLPSDVKCNIWVQHRPDAHADKWSPKILGDRDVTSFYLNTGYSVGFQTTKVNNTYSIEIPYYQPFAFIMSQRTKLSKPVAQSASSLGTLYMGFEQAGGPIKKFPVSVFYCLGDDAYFEYFQGFPPMIPISSDITVNEQLTTAVHEGILDSLTESASKSLAKSDLVKGVVTRLTDTVESAVDRVVTDEGINIRHNVTLNDVKMQFEISEETRNFINNSGSKSAEFIGKLAGNPSQEDAQDVATNFITWLNSITGLDFGVDLVSQIMHCVINPVRSTIALATVTILIKLKLVTTGMFDTLIKHGKNLLAYFNIGTTCDTPPNLNETGGVSRANHEANFDIISSFIDVAFVAVSSMLQVTISPPKNIADFTKILTKEMSQNVRTANQITLFMKNNIALFKKVAEYCTTFLNKDKIMEKLVQDDLVPLLSWIDECEVILDPANEERSYARDSEWAKRVDETYFLGCAINKHFENYVMSSNNNKATYDLFNNMMHKIGRRREAMFKRGNGTVTRREPFCIWIHGTAGVGKSQLAQYIVPKLLARAGISYLGEPIYTLASGAKYWTGCRAQPAILMDDFLNVQTGEIRDESIRQIFAIKSPAALNPPMAHLEDKELRYYPEILIICSNHDFPELNNCHMPAVWRRREVLLSCSLNPHLLAQGYKNFSENNSDIKQYCDENNIDYTNFEHMRITYAINPSENTTKYSDPLMLSQLMNKLHNDFKNYRSSQSKLYDQRKADYDSRLAATNGDVTSLRDKQAEFRRMCTALNDFKWHERVSFKEIMRLSHLYSTTGTISDEMMACLVDQKSLVQQKFETTRADSENDPSKPYVDPSCVQTAAEASISATVVQQTSPVPLEEQGAAACSKSPPPERDDIVHCDTQPGDVVSIVHADNLVFYSHASTQHDSAYLATCQKVCQDWFGLKVPFEPFCASMLHELIAANKLDKVSRVSSSYAVGIHYAHVQVEDKKAFLMCLYCNRAISGATTHPHCNSIRWLNLNLPSTSLYFTPKTIQFHVNAVQKEVMDNAAGMQFIDACRILYCRDDIWPNIHHNVAKMLEQVMLVQFKAVDAKHLRQVLDAKFKDESEINQLIVAGRIQDTIAKKYPSCTHSKIKYDWDMIFLLSEEKLVFTPEDAGDELRIPDGPCGEECVLVKDPTLGEALYKEWLKQNESSEHKPKYFLDQRAHAAAGPTNAARATANATLFSKFRKFFSNLWDKVKKLGDWLWRHIKPCLKPLWKFMKYSLVFFLLIGCLWGIYALATGSAVGASLNTAATVVGSAVAGTCATVGATWTRIVGNKTVPEVATAAHEGSTVYNQVISSGSKNPPPKAVTFVRPESNPNVQKINEILVILERNTYFVTPINCSTTWHRILGIYQNYFLIQKHYYEAWVNSKSGGISVWRNDGTVKLTINIEDVVLSALPDKSLAIIHIPSMPYCRKITHLFASYNDHTVPRGTCHMFEVMPNKSVFVHDLKVAYKDKLIVNATRESTEQQLEGGVYEYTWHGNGRCGSYLIAPHLNHPIIGIHTAGANNIGYADPVASEMFTQFGGDMYTVGYNNDDTPHPSFKANYLPIGRTDQSMSHDESGVSRIVPSLISGVFPVVSEPAPLRKGDKRVEVPEGEIYSPLWSGVSNMGILTKDFPKKDRDTAQDYIAQRLITLAVPNRDSCGPLSFNDAICGIPSLPHYESLNFATSEGFPWSRFRPAGERSKEWLFELQTDEHGYRVLYSINPLLWDQMTRETQDRLEGNPVSTIFDDCLKDARLPLEKVKKPGKTRIFSISPVQYTIVFKRYFGDFLSAFTSARLKLSHAIGIACDSSEWGALARELRSKGTYYITGDYKNFGPGLNTMCLRAVCKTILMWYEHYDRSPTCIENMKIRKALLQELVCARHCAHDFIYSVLAGLPSGCPATAPLNSLVNEMYMLCAWLGLTCGTEYCSLDQFYKLTKLITYGDDFILSVHSSVIDMFNGITIQGYFNTFDIIMTSADKSSEVMLPYVTDLGLCTFLKRGFVQHPSRPYELLAPLDIDFSVKDVANWVHKTPDMILATQVNAEACVRNAYGHGERTYNEIKQRIIDACAKHNIPVLLRTWHEWDALFFPLT